MSKNVEVLTKNIFHGPNLQQLEVGTVVEVSDEVAEKWIAAGNAKASDKKKADQTFEVATPVPGEKKPDTSRLEKQIADLTSQIEKSEQEKSDLQTKLDAQTARADAAEKSLDELKKK